MALGGSIHSILFDSDRYIRNVTFVSAKKICSWLMMMLTGKTSHWLVAGRLATIYIKFCERNRRSIDDSVVLSYTWSQQVETNMSRESLDLSRTTSVWTLLMPWHIHQSKLLYTTSFLGKSALESYPFLCKIYPWDTHILHPSLSYGNFP